MLIRDEAVVGATVRVVGPCRVPLDTFGVIREVHDAADGWTLHVWFPVSTVMDVFAAPKNGGIYSLRVLS